MYGASTQNYKTVCIKWPMAPAFPNHWMTPYRIKWYVIHNMFLIPTFQKYLVGLLWSWLFDGWICNYLCNQFLLPRMLWVWIQWFSLGTLISSTNKTNFHDITEILLKVALNTINLNPTSFTSVLFMIVIQMGTDHKLITDIVAVIVW